jgi:hypothetical protein
MSKSPGVRSTLDPRVAAMIGAGLQSGAVSVTSSDLETHDPRFVGRVSDQIRRSLDEALYRALGWRALQDPLATSQLVANATSKSETLACLLSTSGRGYVREAAVSRIAILGPFGLAMLVNRLNDWVPNVRRAAELRLNELLPTLDRSVVTGCIEYLWVFDDYGRATSEGRAIVNMLIAEDAVTERLRRHLLQSSDDRTVRLLQRMLRAPVVDDLLGPLATRHKHPRVRAIAAKVALEGVVAWRSRTTQKRSVSGEVDRLSLAHELLNDRSVDVQYFALQYLSQNLEDAPGLDDILKHYLLHSRAKLSETAQWKLNKRGVDWLSWLRQQLKERPVDAALARVLSRAGAKSDGEHLWQSAQFAPESSRFTFVLAAARLKQEDALEETRTIALSGPDIGASRSAVSALLDAGEIISASELNEAASDALGFIRRGLLAHLRRQSIVSQLAIFCRLEKSGHPPDGQEFARLTRRINQGKFESTPSDLDNLRKQSAGCPRMETWMRRLQLA